MDTMTERVAVAEDWRPLQRNSLRGFDRCRFPSGIIVHDISVHADGNGKWWCFPPSKPMVGRDGTVMRDDSGNARYAPVIEFATKHARALFSHTVLDALRLVYPEALA